jgi:2-haloacid dehalogenase
MKPKALLFDVFGTVVNWRLGITRDITTHFQNHPCNHASEVIADAWRAQYQSSMEPIRSGRRGYVDLDTLHTENLESVAEMFHLELGTPEEKKWLIEAWHRLPCWPDSVSGIRALQRRFICASQSNAHIALAVNLARHNQFAWDVILGSEVVRTYKPAPEAYTRASEALGLRPEECMMVAAHNYDLKAAQEVGFQTAFIRRPTEHGPDQRIDLEANGYWDMCAESLTDLATQLSCH